MDYKEYNDYELLYLVQESEENAYQKLYDKYKYLITKIAFKYAKPNQSNGIDINDLMIEGYIGLDKAIKGYNNDDSKFQTFAYICIERQIVEYLRKMTARKFEILNNSVSYDNTSNSENSFIELIKDNNGINPENILINREYNTNVFDYINKNFKGLEYKIILFKINGYSNQEISKVLNKNIKSINNALNRIRKKIKNITLNI